MAQQLFPRQANAIARASIAVGAFLLVAVITVLVLLDQSDYSTRTRLVPPQPVPFSHVHHVSGLGIDCRYCHTSVETSSFAGIPPTATCMNCHKQIWSDSPMLEPVRQSFATGEPLVWSRIYDLPDYVYFNHSIHVAKGIGCSSCHGRVDRMPLTFQEQPLFMHWCLDCHRDPGRQIRPRSEIVNMDWQPPDDGGVSARRLLEDYDVADARDITNCSTCHR
ncbi:MAG: cytochrome c3 family protein [Candidatus Eiseniibacteriota bacterium]|jgi:hypothetical protein